MNVKIFECLKLELFHLQRKFDNIITHKNFSRQGVKQMFSLEDLLGQEQGTQAVEQISQNLGANSSVVNSAIQIALPAILGGLAQNAQNPQGAQNLNNALEKDHGGGLLDNLIGLSRRRNSRAAGSHARDQRRRHSRSYFRHKSNTGRTASQPKDRTRYGTGRTAFDYARADRDELSRQAETAAKSKCRRVFQLARRAAAADSAIAAEQYYQQHLRPRRRRFGDGRSGFAGV